MPWFTDHIWDDKDRVSSLKKNLLNPNASFIVVTKMLTKPSERSHNLSLSGYQEKFEKLESHRVCWLKLYNENQNWGEKNKKSKHTRLGKSDEDTLTITLLTLQSLYI